LDTGINNGHPILAPLIKDSDKHTIDITKGTNDKAGHGTNMAGIAAFFRLEDKCRFAKIPFPYIKFLCCLFFHIKKIKL